MLSLSQRGTGTLKSGRQEEGEEARRGGNEVKEHKKTGRQKINTLERVPVCE